VCLFTKSSGTFRSFLLSLVCSVGPWYFLNSLFSGFFYTYLVTYLKENWFTCTLRWCLSLFSYTFYRDWPFSEEFGSFKYCSNCRIFRIFWAMHFLTQYFVRNTMCEPCSEYFYMNWARVYRIALKFCNFMFGLINFFWRSGAFLKSGAVDKL
jgi:hypothetical protein